MGKINLPLWNLTLGHVSDNKGQSVADFESKDMAIEYIAWKNEKKFPREMLVTVEATGEKCRRTVIADLGEKYEQRYVYEDGTNIRDLPQWNTARVAKDIKPKKTFQEEPISAEHELRSAIDTVARKLLGNNYIGMKAADEMFEAAYMKFSGQPISGTTELPMRYFVLYFAGKNQFNGSLQFKHYYISTPNFPGQDEIVHLFKMSEKDLLMLEAITGITELSEQDFQQFKPFETTLPTK